MNEYDRISNQLSRHLDRILGTAPGYNEDPTMYQLGAMRAIIFRMAMRHPDTFDWIVPAREEAEQDAPAA